LDLFFVAELSFARSARSDLHTLREVKLLETHAGLRRDLAYIEQASYCAKLVEMATESETPLSGLFDRFCALLAALPLAAAQPLTIFVFELALLNDLGLKPDLADASLTPGSRLALERAMEMGWDQLPRLKLDVRQAHEIQRFLHGFILFHLERVPQGRSQALHVAL
jgi:DNA repair protein RecO